MAFQHQEGQIPTLAPLQICLVTQAGGHPLRADDKWSLPRTWHQAPSTSSLVIFRTFQLPRGTWRGPAVSPMTYHGHAHLGLSPTGRLPHLLGAPSPGALRHTLSCRPLLVVRRSPPSSAPWLGEQGRPGATPRGLAGQGVQGNSKHCSQTLTLKGNLAAPGDKVQAACNKPVGPGWGLRQGVVGTGCGRGWRPRSRLRDRDMKLQQWLWMTRASNPESEGARGH